MGAEAPGDCFTFDKAVEFKEDEGWKSQKRKGQWEDVCPDCQ